jgi:penicillin amidase
MVKIFKFLFWSFFTFLVTTLAYGFWLCYRSRPETTGTLRLHGLERRVEVLRDAVGVPHIFAQSFDDAVFVQGYVTAQDRLWQMDLLRRLGYGELSEIFGPRTLESDREQRVLGFKRLVAQQEPNLPAEELHCLQRYAAGVNAFISTHRGRLPIEFELLRYQPSPWSPRDTLVLSLWMGKLLSTSWETDLMREMIYKRVDRSIADRLLVEFSPNDLLVVGSDGSTSLQQAVPTPVSAENHRQLAGLLTSSELHGLLFSWPSSAEAETLCGSNNWVVAGTRTVGGKPLLANDPHLPPSVPSIWYMVHLHVPDTLNVIGVTIPGAPGVVLGHNENIAWGATNLAADVQDLYVERVDPQDPLRYWAHGSWQRMEQYSETIKIKGEESQVIQVRSTRHGPVIKELSGRVLALRWTLLDPKVSLPIAVTLDKATSWEHFLRSMREFSGPPQNFVYADREGNIGFANAGKIPIRKRGDGSVPVPGDNDNYEWAGTIPFDQLPREFNPASGLIVTANNRVVGTSYPHFLTHQWASPHRARRIHDLLESTPRLQVSDMLRIQGDVYSSIHSLISGSILGALQNLGKTSVPSARQGQLNKIQAQLENWNYVASESSIGTTLCEAFRENFLEEVLRNKLGEDWSAYRWLNSSTCVEDLLRNRDLRFLPKKYPSYEVFILDCLLKAADRLTVRYQTATPDRWKWGEYLPAELKHPLGRFWPLTTLLNAGPVPQPGTPLTIKQTSSRVGVSMRMVVDFADLDQSLNNLTLGQSGQVFQSHYRDQFQHWLTAQSYPMLFTTAQIRKAAVAVLSLEPE